MPGDRTRTGLASGSRRLSELWYTPLKIFIIDILLIKLFNSDLFSWCRPCRCPRTSWWRCPGCRRSRSARCRRCSGPRWAAPGGDLSRRGPWRSPAQPASPAHTDMGQWSVNTNMDTWAYLQKLEHAERTVRCSVVRPRGELKMTHESENRAT